MAAAAARHALRDGLQVEITTVLWHSVLPALIGMQDRLVARTEPLKSARQYLFHHVEQRALGGLIGNDFPVVQAHARREVQLLSPHIEFRYVSHPLFIGLSRLEVSCQDVGRGARHLAFEYTVFLHPHQRLQLQLVHQPLYGFMVDQAALLPQHDRDAPIAVAAFVLVIDRSDSRLHVSVFVTDLQRLVLIIKSASRHASSFEQACKGILMP